MSCRIWMDSETDLAFFPPILPGEKLRLRDEVYKQVEIRDWMFAGFGNGGLISLCHGTRGYIWEAKVQEIDWEEYWERKVMR
jgi:hypothetical protein